MVANLVWDYTEQTLFHKDNHNIMPRKDAQEPERDSNDAGRQPANGVNGLAPSASPPSPGPSYGNAYGSLSQQFPFVDPGVMAMTNTAATIAAVAASALQQITQAKSPPLPSNAASASVNPALMAALGGRKPLLPSHQAHGGAAGVSSHLAAALLGSAVPSAPAVPYPKHPGSSIHAGIHQALSPADTSSTLHHSAAAAAHATASSISSALLPNMQSWSTEQLEQHVNLLHRLNQPVPQSVALLLADAQRKEKKRKAKRVANRKSASTSRARKKALVEEMTKINARLKRQALILALLPDLVIAITTDGEITFCSDQVQKVLMYNIDDLMGAKLRSLIAPGSRDALSSLIKAIVKSDNRQASREAHAGQGRAVTKRRRSNPRNSNDTSESKAAGGNGKEEEGNDSRRGSSRSTGGSGGDTSAAAIVSEQSFPLSVVEVESKRSAIGPPAAPRNGHANAETNENSDTSTSHGGKQQLSSLTNSASRSPTASSFGEDDGGRGSRDSGGAGGSKTKKNPPSSDDSSSLSSEAKNMRKANDNLDRNVRWHNRRMLEDTKKRKSDFGPKDDVTGASVTANNASARLSSLKHNPFISKGKDDKSPRYERNEDQSSSDDSLLAGVEEKKKTENVSDDSGYRESNDSREETSSSGSDTSNSNDKERRKKKLASTCKICLIRKDLSTVWCEVTSSIRTRSSDEDMGTDDADAAEGNPPAGGNPEDATSAKTEVKELLLCLRPIRDGEKKVDEAYRFVPLKQNTEEETSPADDVMVGVVSSGGSKECENFDEKASTEKTSAESGATSNSGGGSNSTSLGTSSKRPPKKRPLPESGCSSKSDDRLDETGPRKRAREDGPVHASDTEKSVVESLMLMNKSQ